VSLTTLYKYDIPVSGDLIFVWLWLPLKGIYIEREKIIVQHLSITSTQKKVLVTDGEAGSSDGYMNSSIRFDIETKRFALFILNCDQKN
jgi:hypothetical protein